MQIDTRWRFGWVLVTAVLLAALVYFAPTVATQAPTPGLTALAKLSLVMLAGILGYLLDLALYPYARPDGFLRHGEWPMIQGSIDGDADYPVVPGYEIVYAAAQIRRAIIVAASILGVALGL